MISDLEQTGQTTLVAGLHAALDATVLATYGFDPEQDLLAQLLARNREVAARVERGGPVTASGIPPGFVVPEKLVTEDCIRPPD